MRVKRASLLIYRLSHDDTSTTNYYFWSGGKVIYEEHGCPTACGG